MRRRLALPVFAAIALAACVQTRAVRLGDPIARPAIRPDSVRIYRTASQVPGKYDEVAQLDSRGSMDYSSTDAMYASMRKQAGQLGANAIILDGISEPGHARRLLSALTWTDTERKGKAVAIYVHPVVPAVQSGATSVNPSP